MIDGEDFALYPKDPEAEPDYEPVPPTAEEQRRLLDAMRNGRQLHAWLAANVPSWATKTPLEIASVLMSDDERWWVDGALVVDCEPMAALLTLIAGAQAGAPSDPVAAAGVSAYGIVGGKLRQALA